MNTDKVHIVIRSDDYIAGVFTTSEGASNYCMRLNGKTHYYSFRWESFEVDEGDGLDGWLDD